MKKRDKSDKAKVAEIMEKVTCVVEKRNTESREKAIAELVATGATAIYADHTVVLNALNNMTKVALAGCPDGIPGLSLYVSSLMERLLVATTWFSYRCLLIRADMPDEEVLSLGEFREDEEYLSHFLGDGECRAEEYSKHHRAHCNIIKALFVATRAMAVFSKSVGAEEASKAWIDATSMATLMARLVKAKTAVTVETAEILLKQLQLAHQLIYREWAYERLPSLEDLRKDPEA